MHPVWFLDVDGVLNADREPSPPWPEGKTARVSTPSTGETWTIRWAPALIDRIKALLPRVDITWSTTWCSGGDVRELEALWGLPRLLTAWDDQLAGYQVRRAKMNAVASAVQLGRRVIWTDDQLPYIGENLTNMLYTEVQPLDRLYVRPTSLSGLTPRHMNLIEARVARWEREDEQV